MNITKTIHSLFEHSLETANSDSEKSFSEFFYDLNNPFNFYFGGHASINTISINTNNFDDLMRIINILVPDSKSYKIIKENANVNNGANNYWASLIIKSNDDKVIIKLEYNEKYDTELKKEKSSDTFGYDSGTSDEKQFVVGVTIAYSPVDTPVRDRIFDAYKASFDLIEVEEPTAKIYVLEKEGNNLVLVPKTVEGFELDIEKHYNDDFNKVSKEIEGWISDIAPPKDKEDKNKNKNKKLALLHGEPGTGKTNYIKYLLSVAPSVKKIYIPPWYVSALGDPGFFTFIKRYSNSILIVEDAEKVLLARDDFQENSAISVLLNLTDGILAEILNLKVIATFNTDEEKIDKALKRKGRLFKMYKFKTLNKEKTGKLVKELYGENARPPKEEMSLAEIYNPDDNGILIEVPKKAIGFGC